MAWFKYAMSENKELPVIHLSYIFKCLALSITFFAVFYFAVLLVDPSFDKYTLTLGISTLLFPIVKCAIDIVKDAVAPNYVMFNGALSSLLINITIWLLTPFLIVISAVAFLFYSMGVLKENSSN